MLTNDELKKEVVQRTLLAAQHAAAAIDDLSDAIGDIVDGQLEKGAASVVQVIGNYKARLDAYIQANTPDPETAGD